MTTQPTPTEQPFRIHLDGKYYGVLYAASPEAAIASMRPKLGSKFETTEIRAGKVNNASD